VVEGEAKVVHAGDRLGLLPDLVLLDIRLPGEDGLMLARCLRERYDVGIIMVTASGDVIDRVVGLELGADGYVAKPFDPRELLACVKSVMRRMQARPHGDEASPPATPGAARQRVAFGRCQLDVDARHLFERDGAEIALTAMKYELLRVLLANPNRVLSRDAAAHAPPRLGAVRPLHRHPHRAVAAQGRAGPWRRAAHDPLGAQRRLHVRARLIVMLPLRRRRAPDTESIHNGRCATLDDYRRVRH